MTNDDSVLREVDRAVAEDRQWDFLKRNGPALIAGGVAIVAAVGGWQIWAAQKASRAGEAAVEFNAATDALRQSPEDGRAALESIASEAPAGYAALANLRRAASLANSNDRPGALAAYRQVYNEGDAPSRLRDLARLRAASLSLADGRDAVLGDLGSLTESDSAFGPYARELSAVAALTAKDYETAHSMFEKLAGDLKAPETVRQRAEEFAALAAAARAGVNITGEARVDDLMKALESPAGESHEGHGHEAPAGEGTETPPAAENAPAVSESEEQPEAAPNGDGAMRQ